MKIMFIMKIMNAMNIIKIMIITKIMFVINIIEMTRKYKKSPYCQRYRLDEFI